MQAWMWALTFCKVPTRHNALSREAEVVSRSLIVRSQSGLQVRLDLAYHDLGSMQEYCLSLSPSSRLLRNDKLRSCAMKKSDRKKPYASTRML